MTRESDITELAAMLGQRLRQRALTVTTAESCTGGGIAEAITRVAGSSAWFRQAWVVYSNAAKVSALGVADADLALHGAVSAPVAAAMAAGACRHAGADWAIAVSGIAGPDGGTADKPVGLVWFAWAGPLGVDTESCVFPGDRAQIRRATVAHALQGLLRRLA